MKTESTILEVTETGYYDTQSDKVKMLRKGDRLTPSDGKHKAPCISKIRKGIWVTTSDNTLVFVENGNYEALPA